MRNSFENSLAVGEIPKTLRMLRRCVHLLNELENIKCEFLLVNCFFVRGSSSVLLEFVYLDQLNGTQYLGFCSLLSSYKLCLN